MSLAIVSAALVTPVGLTLAQHAFFTRAGVLAPAPQAFETGAGERVDTLHCGFLGAALPIAERLARLSEIAVHQALAPWEEVEPAARVGLLFVTPERPGLDASAIEALRGGLAKRCRAAVVQSARGAAGAFAALSLAERWLQGGGERGAPGHRGAQSAQAVLLVAADSMISPEALAEDRRSAQSPFAPSPPAASEGAAAVLVARGDDPRARSLGGARVLGAGAAIGQGNDDDDAIVDGVAMTALLRGLPARAIRLVVGQAYVDDLRTRDFQLASARTARRFAGDMTHETLERSTGRLGVAAGVAQLAYGVTVLRHGTIRGIDPGASFLAWAISRDGLRGAALVEGA